jgi:histidyl-tRNA synthetase
MATKGKFQAIKGTRDLLPPETELWNRVEQTAREVFGTYGFGEIRPPVFEATELFARSIGTDTDVVSKEMYSFHEASQLIEGREFIVGRESTGEQVDAQAYVILYFKYCEESLLALKRGAIPRTPQNVRMLSDFENGMSFFREVLYSDKKTFDSEQIRQLGVQLRQILKGLDFGISLSLRPEATAGICRAYIEHNMQQWPAPVKLYYIGPMFRRERPQKGRYRQFYQIDAEVLGGNDAPGIDAEVIEMVMVFFAKLELPGVQLEINSIGHSAPECRRGYVEKLRVALENVKDKLGPDSQRRVETNPLRVLDSKLESEQAIIETLPRIGDHLCEDCAKHYAEVKRQLHLRGVKYKENWRLVRGLDYYMRTTFEITAQGLGSQNAVCGGGRYDGLIELLGGPPTKGIGFAIGEDRLILSLLEAGHSPLATHHSSLVYIAWMGEKAQTTAIAAARKLRETGLRVELPPAELKFGKALGQADKLGARVALILGEDEVSSGQWTVKNLADGTQTKVAAEELVGFLKGVEK